MELSIENAGEWLAAHGIDSTGGAYRSLGGGISNHVMLAEVPSGPIVIKQSLGQLRVADEWLSERERIFREAAAMRWLAGKVRGGRVPKVLAEDRENFVIAMEAAPPRAEMWKTRLFSGTLSSEDATRAGVMLESIIQASEGSAEAKEIFGDQTVFDQLRIDPYYRTTAARHPKHAWYFEQLIARSSARRISLTHGDWSPKNLLTDGEEMWAIDWEVVHYGDPAFDIAFLLNHLFLKSVAMPEKKTHLAELAGAFLNAFGESWIIAGAGEHLPALLLARVDGKSPAEYLDSEMRDHARSVALDAMDRSLAHPLEIFER